MSLVVDSSVILAVLLNQGDVEAWAVESLGSEVLVGPHHLPAEVAKVLRRRTLAGELLEHEAAIAHAEMLTLEVELYPYAPLAARVWQLRETVTITDAWYVALAEFLEAPLITLDRRLSRAPGPRCRFLTPPES